MQPPYFAILTTADRRKSGRRMPLPEDFTDITASAYGR